ncbi:MAG: hypothetical protein HY279_02635 [Nitrospinae bacterium]|nr:hypothetical protein [Nitrospinota bacterium]
MDDYYPYLVGMIEATVNSSKTDKQKVADIKKYIKNPEIEIKKLDKRVEKILREFKEKETETDLEVSL